MKKKLIIYILPLILFACQQEEELTRDSDDGLIGTWTNSLKIINFNSNSTYNIVVIKNVEGIPLRYDSIAGDFYTVNSKNSLVFEPKLGRLTSDSSKTDDISSSSAQIITYSISNNRLTFEPTNGIEEYAKCKDNTCAELLR